ncbi:MAG: UDP-N-acetylmuramoyl-tripeptide--D-alanyl-D-alanine ligase [Hyphomicrobiaceae bacterium hypho_1]
MVGIFDLAAYAAFIFFSLYRLLRYLHIFQQDEYNTVRFAFWLVTKMAFDKRVSATLIFLEISNKFIQNVTLVPTFLETVLVTLLFIVAGVKEPNPLRVAKKRLVLTKRLKRLLATSMILTFITAYVATTIGSSIAWLVAVQFIQLIIILANWLLKPIEICIQKSFKTAAKNRFCEIAPCTVGITGSFGKTSVKHILGHILQMNTNAQFTPGSINTVMGIARVINEKLEDNCRYFLAEMGAYGIGSISRLCTFIPPKHGIITSIGEAHYERFKDLETVSKAKFELAQAVSRLDGKVVLDESVLEHISAYKFVEQNRKMFIIVGMKSMADIKILSIEQTMQGLYVKIYFEANEYLLFAPIYGLHHARNMVLASAMALNLGFSIERIIQSLRTTPQISHRLEVKKHSCGATYIDDSYNANPNGISNGLDLLQVLRNENGRRILITPGIIELGTIHDEVHCKLGKKAALATDITVVVNPERVEAFLKGFKSVDGSGQLFTCDKFSDAQTWIGLNLRPYDTLLIANDLPDLIESRFIC